MSPDYTVYTTRRFDPDGDIVGCSKHGCWKDNPPSNNGLHPDMFTPEHISISICSGFIGLVFGWHGFDR